MNRKKLYITAEVIAHLSSDDDRKSMALFSARRTRQWPRMRAYHADGDEIVIQKNLLVGWFCCETVPLRNDWRLLKGLFAP